MSNDENLPKNYQFAMQQGNIQKLKDHFNTKKSALAIQLTIFKFIEEFIDKKEAK